VHVQPVITTLQGALLNAGALAGGDPAVEAAVNQLVEALTPAVRQAALQLAEQAAGEVSAQLVDRTVEVVVVDGDPTLRVTDAPAAATSESAEDFDARITLRLPPSLKQLVEDAADAGGESVNTWVVDALGKRARRRAGAGSRVSSTFDL
jgi:hypothetical protein